MTNDIMEFLWRVRDMREAQKKYFALRRKEDLVESKRLEKEVDTQIDAILTTFKRKEKFTP
jgi:hypothetical protein